MIWPPWAEVVLLLVGLSGLPACDEFGNPDQAQAALRTEVVAAKVTEAQQLLAQVPAHALDYRDTSAGPGFSLALVRVERPRTGDVSPIPLRTVFHLEDGTRVTRTWTMRGTPGPRYALFALRAAPLQAQTMLIRR